MSQLQIDMETALFIDLEHFWRHYLWTICLIYLLIFA